MRAGHHEAGECSRHHKARECCTFRREARERRCSEAQNAVFRNDVESSGGADPAPYLRHGKTAELEKCRECCGLHALAATRIRDVETTQHVRRRCRGETESEMALSMREGQRFVFVLHFCCCKKGVGAYILVFSVGFCGFIRLIL